MLEALEPFGLGDFTSLITEIQLQNWGKTLVIQGLYDPHGQNLPFTLTLHQCYDIRWQPLSPDLNPALPDSEPADLIDLQLQTQGDRSTAIFYTDLFELTVGYDRLTCHTTPTSLSLISA
ncbi:hypothetical protein [Prochlorothrix hollandica]|uniref:Uncharacterized protein n=1 Tax=Prochlorothrix hollandica PCC 9006 = CALU 1027 TaxID=317619 RepID=A0A0M2PST6_PROHO|nr:hypothetical protein [Prochlorothrix hollandica]KKI99595.1 hypothetical protein PROH_06700 [Prochlorothrix hollandica PCC 9006 = CALU 1027]